MLRRRHIDADRGGSRLHTVLTAPWRLLMAIGWAIRERLLWPAGDLLRNVGELLKWPFQRLGWGVERRLLWPSRERVAGWGYLRRIAGVGALAAVAIGATALGAYLASEEESAEPASELVAVSPLASPADSEAGATQEPAEPALRGAAPVFGVGGGIAVSSVGDGKDGSSSTASGADDSGQSDVETGADETKGAATTSKQKPVPAGPAAMKVARRFSEAFVFYEVGKRPERAKVVFEETASPQLAEALIERPPRLPENVKVPKARVVNVVPGPRRAKTYSISVSLLRVGATSELRLSLKKEDGVWLVTDVRG